ncbi:MAG: VCBS repeat-containing protein [Lachnospiraceae bacterium]|nr:VCBS repeat-containing protein [Lachnospiraceae bacterium]
MIKQKGRTFIGLMLSLALCICAGSEIYAADGVELALLRDNYVRYEASFQAIENITDIENNGFTIIQDQVFPVLLESFGEVEVTFVPALNERYGRLAVFICNEAGEVLYKTNQLETNYHNTGQLKQPTEGIAAVGFHDVNQDALTDIVLITECVNEEGEYAGKTYKVGDVLFQREGSFYRDYRISDKINRFSMNKSVEFIIAYVRDGHSTEILYNAQTLEELKEQGFKVAEQTYYRNFEKQGRLLVVPGTLKVAEYTIFMIYLVNEEGNIVYCFQPMGDYDNLYSFKGISCKDMDGDGMKDLVVLTRYNGVDENGERVIYPKCDIYYQRTGGFDVDEDFHNYYRYGEADTMEIMVQKIREYWGWEVTND